MTRKNNERVHIVFIVNWNDKLSLLYNAILRKISFSKIMQYFIYLDHNANNDLPNDDYNKTMNNETDIDIESLFKLRNGKHKRM